MDRARRSFTRPLSPSQSNPHNAHTATMTTVTACSGKSETSTSHGIGRLDMSRSGSGSLRRAAGTLGGGSSSVAKRSAADSYTLGGGGSVAKRSAAARAWRHAALSGSQACLGALSEQQLGQLLEAAVKLELHPPANWVQVGVD